MCSWPADKCEVMKFDPIAQFTLQVRLGFDQKQQHNPWCTSTHVTCTLPLLGGTSAIKIISEMVQLSPSVISNIQTNCENVNPDPQGKMLSHWVLHIDSYLDGHSLCCWRQPWTHVKSYTQQKWPQHEDWQLECSKQQLLSPIIRTPIHSA